MPTIPVTFINQSNDMNDSEIIFFQDTYPEAGEQPQEAIAWKVIKKCPRGQSVDFTFSTKVSVGVRNNEDVLQMLQPATPGFLWKVAQYAGGPALAPAKGIAPTPDLIYIMNELPAEKMNACLYRNGRLLATRKGLAPMHKAGFAVTNTIYVAVVSMASEGAALPMKVVKDGAKKFTLRPDFKAIITWTGGGPGKPFDFTMEEKEL